MKLSTEPGKRLVTLAIREVIDATPRARIVRVDLDGHSFDYRPGQAVLLGMHGDVRRRVYSLAGTPEEAVTHRYLELLVGCHDNGQFVPNVSFAPGVKVDVEGPIGGFVLPPEPPSRLLFVAGGTGIAPLRSMLRHALSGCPRDLRLIYSARNADDFAYRTEFEELARDGRLRLHLTMTREAQPTTWLGSRGRIGLDNLPPVENDDTTLCFVAGPHSFVRDTTELLQRLGIHSSNIRIQER